MVMAMAMAMAMVIAMAMVMVMVMSYVLMPFMTKRFAFWLFGRQHS